MFIKSIITTAVLASSVLASTVVIVNPGSGVDSLDVSQVKKIFLAKTKSFPNGESAVPVDQDSKNPAYEAFYKAVAGKSAVKMNKYWVKLTFTGKAEAPKKVGSSSDVVGLIKNNKNMIGYADSADVTADVKVVYTVK
ncbi:phosphate ABC transporter substrate-binding protein [Candidatus Sulfurimonas marisnigri]|uniref:Phosphate ABC transporter substrate-binding protein n=1 Tax=Candidatus Sulfurimonas marisnigri TaxID=2740405 RepID=A0A7S7M0B6_9BACT|nr:phosphate ABC transporter substrate-binding protein [Candidatus Sulfurimonas marisnigri]QOY54767.1 phosphate ABC transporter substrate-binding protein [Candidatus Sulfurimonas marisnigri]